MPEEPIPPYVDMLLPTLQTLERLGGSGTREEIDPDVIRAMDLTPAQLAVEYPPGATQRGPKVIHRLAWARTYLKKMGAANNSSRGVWTLGPEARRYLDLPETEARAQLRSMDSEIRRQHRLSRSVGESARPAPDANSNPDDAPEGDLSEDPDLDDADWSGRLLQVLTELDPSAFERLAQRLLREAGFRNVEVLGRSGDGGIDGVGVYRPSLVSFPVFFQCKRYRGSVGPAMVRDFRGAMAGRGEKGILITTGTFTSESRREATRDGAPPVDLIDGTELCRLLKEFGIGVETTLVEVVQIESSYFESLQL